MSDAANPASSIPSRSKLIRSVHHWSPIEDVALAVSVATEDETRLYVERLDDRYRWSLIHQGGPYPLLRITARFLQVDHHSIVVGYRAIGDGYTALYENPHLVTVPAASAILTFDGPTPKEEAARLIREALE